MRLPLLLIAPVLLACAEDAPIGPPNVVLISLDTLRADRLSCYGYDRPTTPTIDALAAAGTLFEDASATSPWTAPSHASMLTGLFSAHHGVLNLGFRLPTEAVTLAEALGAAGYQTFGAVNSINLGLPTMEFDQGFERYSWTEETAETADGTLVVPNTGREVAAVARAMVEERDPERPFFLFLHVYDTHADLSPEERYREEFVAPYSGPVDGTAAQFFQMIEYAVQVDQAGITWLREMYDAEVRQVDDLVADFLAFLEEEGVRDDTLIVLTSDHGEEFFEHGFPGHARTQYQEVLAIPLILSGPGVPRGRRIAEPVGLVDVFPTVLALAGVDSVDPQDGLDLSAHWDAPGILAERPLFSGANISNVVDNQRVANTQAMVRLGDHKLVVDRLTMRTKLYDLSQDPGELTDLSEEEPQRVQLLMRVLARHLDTEVEWSEQAPLSEEDMERLNALGYTGN
jgi:arylsulfatase A-like enzyme